MPPADPVPRSECKYEGLCPAGPLSVICSRDTIDLLADHSRKLPHIGPTGPEMRISCGAALSGLPSAIPEMGNLPGAQLLPDPAQTDLLARVPRQAVPGPYGRGKLAPLLSLFTADGVTRQRHDRACLPSSRTGPDRSPVPAAHMPRQVPAMPVPRQHTRGVNSQHHHGCPFAAPHLLPQQFRCTACAARPKVLYAGTLVCGARSRDGVDSRRTEDPRQTRRNGSDPRTAQSRSANSGDGSSRHVLPRNNLRSSRRRARAPAAMHPTGRRPRRMPRYARPGSRKVRTHDPAIAAGLRAR